MQQCNRHRQFRRRGVITASLAFAVAAPAIAAELRLPAIVAPASAEHHTGKAIFVELVTPDLNAAKRFYGGMFGWTFHDLDAGGMAYAEALLDGEPVAGLFQKAMPPGDHRQPSWLTYFAVRDVDVAKQTAVQYGAKVLFEPHTFPDRGREAVFADPQGAVFAVLASSNGDPPDLLADPGDWIWTSLITTDPDNDAAFYKALLADEVFALPAGKGTRHFLLASDGYARASVNSPPDNRPDFHPHWLNFVRVEDTVAMTARVVALGGRVLVEPRVDRHGGKVALVADPQGAPFGLLEWPETESKEMRE